MASYNVLSTVKAPGRFHGGRLRHTEISGYDLADEVAGTYRGVPRCGAER